MVAVSIVAVWRGMAASIAAPLVGAFIAESLAGRSSAAVTMVASTMVVDVATGTVAGGLMGSVRAGG